MPEAARGEVGPAPLPEVKTDRLASAAQGLANFMCAVRPLQAADIAKDVIGSQDYRSWKTAGKFAVAVAFDVLDGMLARFAANRRNNETTPTGARLDELADKSLTHIVLGAIAVRSGMDNETDYQRFIVENQATIAKRDLRITKKRNEAQALGVEIKAKGAGKKKTRWQNGTIFMMLSPIAKRRKGRLAVRASQAYSTHLALKSEKIYMDDFNEGIAGVKAEVKT